MGHSKSRRYVPRHATARRGVSAAVQGTFGSRGARAVVAASALAATALTGTQLHSAPQAHAAAQDLVRVSDAQRQADSQRLLDGINAYRQSQGLRPVSYSARLSQIEQPHSDAQIVAENFYHTDAFLTDSRAGNYTHANEVIALSYQRDVMQLLAWWKTSPAHNAAILNPNAQVIGIGLSYADGSLARTGQPWQILGSVNLYGYRNGGAPSDATSTVGGGVAPQSSSSSFAPYGAIGVTYSSNGGGSAFGQPVMAESDATGGRYQIFKTSSGLRYKFLWSERTGAHIVKEFGAIGQVWAAKDFERGYGFPVSNEYRYGSEMRQNFSNGYIIGWNVYDGSVRVYR
ncbi:CAP domain-containing protein [Kocuria sp. HSID16901]|uniref:CAP domain-containing protein n=1 Tax=Kocuria sp. HSID16901 TaxID=2419505 RepID=UPI00066129E7|nr:CAP domain-containing protein [Kocuria sp. HSID16901]MCT1367156.1 CAP domain-containing protein [Rothia sp. p3-SID1597]